ncbi:cupin domain-containing protein [Kytococcus sedentarius]|uniref:AraC family transcriptional regulator n=1 Tax=Kytococcus sedentarius TaxID=1276 RepID=UPI00384D25DD
MDTDHLAALLRARGIFHCDTRLDASTAVELPPLPGTVMYHLVLQGACVVSRGDEAVEAAAGDIVLVPHGAGHVLAATAVPVRRIGLQDSGREELGGGIERLDLAGGTPAAHLVCGAIALEHPASPALPRRLPTLLRARAEEDELAASAAVARLVLQEAEQRAPGWGQVSAHLVEALALREVRRAVQQAAPETGWWAASRDPRIGPVLAAVLGDLAHPWSVVTLAREAGLARSAFNERFTTLTGEPPMAWVTRVRMAEARRLLQEGVGVPAVARRTGYGSEVSFRRAYRRVVGVPPGSTRASLSGTPPAGR